ncbi:MAG: GntP family permease [Planctomycetota bacterium]
MSIWYLMATAVCVVLVLILVFRVHAFLTLLVAGLLVALLAPAQAIESHAQGQVAKAKWTEAAAESYLESSAASRLAVSFGESAGKIGILIALASVIGGLLMESGAASTIIDAMLKITGPKRSPEALAASSFVLGIPVFFDTVFYLMIPLARSLRRKLGRDYVLFILAILAGGSIAHSLVPPTPGPLLVAKELGVDIGTMMLAGLTIGGMTSCLSLLSARVINRFVDLPLRESESEQADKEAAKVQESQAAAFDSRPPLMLSLLPIVLPVILLAAGSTVTSLVGAEVLPKNTLSSVTMAIGDKNVALGIGCVFGFLLLRHCDPVKRKTLVSRSLASAGNIILITSAGGAFGAMLRQAGIAAAVGDLAEGVPGLMLLPLAFAVTVAIRTLQGSATVAMITAAGVLQGLATAEGLPFHPVYLAMAIGAGSKPVSWMTDSAFWVITRMSGMSEAEGLRIISPMSTAMGVSALIVTMACAFLYPAAPV